MSEKIFERKVMSPPSDNANDTTNEESTLEMPKKKKRSKKEKKKSKYCLTCGQNILKNEIRESYMYKDTYHQLKAKEYCKDHEHMYSDHKCKPNWCGDCDYLINYQIEIQKR